MKNKYQSVFTGKVMEKDRSKRILDSTFAHLEKVLEEMRQEKNKKDKILKSSNYKTRNQKKSDPGFLEPVID